MKMTITQKILAAHTGSKALKAGQLIEAEVDRILSNDIMMPVISDVMREYGVTSIGVPEKVTIVLDHYTPCKDIKSARLCSTAKRFAADFGISDIYDVGRMGIEHALLPELGYVYPGELLIGTDSHTCTAGALGAFATGVGSTDGAAAMITGKLWFQVPAAIQVVLNGKPHRYVSGKDIILKIIGELGVDGARYKSLEFSGDGIQHLTMDDRFTVCNMAIECGAKNAVFPVDETAREYLREHVGREYTVYEPDEDAEYEHTLTIDLGKLEPIVAKPHLPSNIAIASDLSDVKVQQVIIGSCTNGRIGDLRIAAEIMKGRHIATGVRCIIIPATQNIYKQAIHEGLIDIFLDAGAAVSTPTCGPCCGGHMGVMADNENTLSTTNRNFIGRMGPTSSSIYLASPATAAATALEGYITAPQKKECNYG
jgi:3-isopropylmalate/(R)-2-methylmalate dehydratase large subunit